MRVERFLHVRNSRGEDTKHSPQMVTNHLYLGDTEENREVRAFVPLEAYFPGDICGVLVRMMSDGSIEVSQDVAVTENFCLGGYTKEKAEKFKFMTEVLGIVSQAEDVAAFTLCDPKDGRTLRYMVSVEKRSF